MCLLIEDMMNYELMIYTVNIMMESYASGISHFLFTSWIFSNLVSVVWGLQGPGYVATSPHELQSGSQLTRTWSVLYGSLYVTIEVILAHNSVHQRVEIFIFLNWDLNINNQNWKLCTCAYHISAWNLRFKTWIYLLIKNNWCTHRNNPLVRIISSQS